MSTAALLEVNEVACYKDEGQPIISGVNFVVNQGDVMVIRGQSGTGKTTLLKCLAHLDLYSGQVTYKGKLPQAHGIPTYRTEVMYIPQRPSLLPLTPRDFVFTVMSFYSRRHSRVPNGSNKKKLSKAELQRCIEAPMLVGKSIGISEDLWDRHWADLSGGEGQRIMLVIGASLETAEILLLDEPTSALDTETTLAVEDFLLSALRKPNSKLKAIVWITHSEDQSRRVGSRFITVSGGTCHEDLVGLFIPYSDSSQKEDETSLRPASLGAAVHTQATLKGVIRNSQENTDASVPHEAEETTFAIGIGPQILPDKGPVALGGETTQIARDNVEEVEYAVDNVKGKTRELVNGTENISSRYMIDSVTERIKERAEVERQGDGWRSSAFDLW